jgi:hypothetical protein
MYCGLWTLIIQEGSQLQHQPADLVLNSTVMTLPVASSADSCESGLL